MNIFWIHAFASPRQENAATRHCSLQRDLKKYNISVTIVACKKSHLTPSRPHHLLCNSSEFIWLPGVSTSRRLVPRLANIVVFFLSVVTLSKKLSKTADVVVGSTPDPLAALAALLLAKRYGKPFVLEVRDVWPETLIEVFKLKPWNPYILLLGFVEKVLCKNADVVLSTLPKVSEHIWQFSPKVPVVHIPNYVSEKEIPKKHVALPKSPITEIVYAGSIGVANDMETLLSAAKILENRGFADRLNFVIFGDGPESDKLKADFGELKIVEFRERIARKDFYERLDQSDAAIICWKKTRLYRHGISANKIADYLFVGLPIIMSYEYPHEIASEFAGLVVPPEEPHMLAGAVEQFLEMDDESRQLLRANALTLGKRSFSFDAFGPKLVKSLLSVRQGISSRDS